MCNRVKNLANEENQSTFLLYILKKLFLKTLLLLHLVFQDQSSNFGFKVLTYTSYKKIFSKFLELNSHIVLFNFITYFLLNKKKS